MKYTNESGRSMVEMLGVLAIIGVLSVGGIAGYSKAMNKYKINKTTDQVSMIVANLRTLFSGQGDYATLSNSQAIKFGVIPNDMLTGSSDGIKNAFNGKVNVVAVAARSAGADNDEAFVVEYDGLSQDACVTIATGDWGSGQGSGLIAVAAGKGSITTLGTLGTVGAKVNEVFVDAATTTTSGGEGEPDVVTGTTKGDGLIVAAPGATIATPITVADAIKACSGGTGGSGYSVAWKYY